MNINLSNELHFLDLFLLYTILVYYVQCKEIYARFAHQTGTPFTTPPTGTLNPADDEYEA